MTQELKQTLRRARRPLIPAALARLLSTALNVYIMLLIRDNLDAALQGELAELKTIVLPIVIAVLLFVPLDLLSAWTKGRFIRTANQLMKGRYIDRVFKKDISEFQGQHLALYLSNITNDMNSVEQRYFLSLYEIMRGAFGALGGIIILLSVHWLVAVLAFVPGAIVAVVALRSGKGLEKHEGERSDFLSQYTIYIREVLSAFRIIRNNNLEKKVSTDFGEKSTAVQNKRFELDKAETMVLMRNNLFFSLLIAVLMVSAMLTVRSGLVTTGGVILIINGYSDIINAFYGVSERLPMIRSERPVFQRMEASLENRRLDAETEDFSHFEYDLVFDRVSFAYEDNRVLENASFQLKKGGKYMLVGPSGGGKSTVLRLIRKYFNPDEGAILIDGENLRHIRRASYYAQLANVEQHVFLFDDSLRDNLTLYKDYSDEAILKAVNDAGLTDFVRRLPGGLDYRIIDNGKNLSGGERARIAIARGLIAHQDILLLDEAFASLDEHVARAIEQNLLALEDVTVISVSHVVFADTAPMYDAIFEVKRGAITRRAIEPA